MNVGVDWPVRFYIDPGTNFFAVFQPTLSTDGREVDLTGDPCPVWKQQPVPMIRYRVKIETSEINAEGLRGWSAALPVYGDDIFAVDCYDVASPSLKHKTDRQILQTLLPSISGLEELVPDKRTVGIEKWPGNEFVVKYENGTRSRIAYCRHKQHFYLLVDVRRFPARSSSRPLRQRLRPQPQR